MTNNPSTKAAHTPGPWWITGGSILAGDPGDPEIVARFEVDDIMGVSERPRARALGFDDRKPDGPDEAEANARLIAAAPDLLASLKEVDAALFARCGFVPPATMEERHMLDCAHAAIAKAEGSMWDAKAEGGAS